MTIVLDEVGRTRPGHTNSCRVGFPPLKDDFRRMTLGFHHHHCKRANRSQNGHMTRYHFRIVMPKDSLPDSTFGVRTPDSRSGYGPDGNSG